MSTYTVLGITASTGSEVQSKIANGTTGQVLTATTGALPSFQDAGGSGVVQLVSSSINSVLTISSAIPYDNTIPQNTEGTEVMTCTITPTNASSKLIINFTGWGETSGGGVVDVRALFQDSTANAIYAQFDQVGTAAMGYSFYGQHTMTAGTTSATTFKLRVGKSANTMYFCGKATASTIFGGVGICNMTILEVAP